MFKENQQNLLGKRNDMSEADGDTKDMSMINKTNQQMPSPAELHRIAALHAARINFRRRGIEIGTKQFDFD